MTFKSIVETTGIKLTLAAGALVALALMPSCAQDSPSNMQSAVQVTPQSAVEGGGSGSATTGGTTTGGTTSGTTGGTTTGGTTSGTTSGTTTGGTTSGAATTGSTTGGTTSGSSTGTAGGTTTGGSTGEHHGGANGNGGEQGAEADDAGLAQCAGMTGADVDQIIITSGTDPVTVPTGKAVAIMVTGNASNVALKVHSDSPTATLKALCLFVTGHLSKVVLTIDATVGALYYQGHGDQSNTSINVEDNGNLTGTFVADLSGNQPKLSVAGTGKYVCPVTQLAGNGPVVDCQQP